MLSIGLFFRLRYHLLMPRNLFLLFGVFIACSNEGQAKSQAAQQNSPSPPTGQQAEKPAQPSPVVNNAEEQSANEGKVKHIEGADPANERFKLVIQTPEAKVGKADSVHIELSPQPPWHINLDFPTSLQVNPPAGVHLSKPEQKKPDALRLDDNGAAFKVEFTAENAGEKLFTGEFKFAVCQDEACAPVTEKVEFKVAVK